MSSENYLVVLSVVLGLLGTQWRKAKRWLQKRSVSLAVGNDTLSLQVTTSSSNQDLKKDDSISQECQKPSSEQTKSKKW